MLIYPVFLPQKGCPFSCIYCQQRSFENVDEPDTKLMKEELDAFVRRNAGNEKQIAFYGGTFTALSLNERILYTYIARSVMDENTTLRISTRPDFISPEILSWCKQNQIKTIELGIQDFDDNVLNQSKRGYNGKTAYDACKLVKEMGFELGIQLILGLPGLSSASQKHNLDMIIRMSPNLLRLYPLVVLENTELWEMTQNGEYTPLELGEAISLCVDFHEKLINTGIKIIKSGIPPLKRGLKYQGPYHPSFGALVQTEFNARKEMKHAIHNQDKGRTYKYHVRKK